MARFYYLLYSNNIEPKFLRTDKSIIMTGDYIHLNHTSKDKNGKFEILKELNDEFNINTEVAIEEKHSHFYLWPCRLIDFFITPMNLKSFNNIIYMTFGVCAFLTYLGTMLEYLNVVVFAAILSFVLSLFLLDFRKAKDNTQKSLVFGIIISVIITYIYFMFEQSIFPNILKINNIGNIMTVNALVVLFADKIKNCKCK